MDRITCVVLSLCSSLALAGPEWPEVGDAGSTPGTAQPVASGGGGTVTKIIGNLEGSGLPDTGLGDYQDMYLIEICDPVSFRASTLPEDNGQADFNASLWLFAFDGHGLLGNQEAQPGLTSPILLSESNDGTGVMLTTPGLYYLAITGAGSVPLSAGGLPIFEFLAPGEISGPDGPGGTLPIDSWTSPGDFGHYEIALQGVCFIVPAPTTTATLVSLGLIGLRRRR